MFSDQYEDIYEPIIKELKSQLTAAQAEIAELNRLSDKQSSQYHALRSKHDNLQSALDVAVEGLERIADKTTLQDFENQTDNKTANSALDKIKQIREKK